MLLTFFGFRYGVGWVGNDDRYISPTQQQTKDDVFNYGGIGGSWCAPYKVEKRERAKALVLFNPFVVSL